MPKAELAALHKELFGTRRLELFDPETAEWTLQATEGYIRYLAAALECSVIVVDPVSFPASFISAHDDERPRRAALGQDVAFPLIQDLEPFRQPAMGLFRFLMLAQAGFLVGRLAVAAIRLFDRESILTRWT